MSARLETNRGDILSGFSEAIKDFSREARLVFTPEGVQLYGEDNAGVVMVQYTLPIALITANEQGKYQCSCPSIEVGVDTKTMAICLGSVTCGDLVSFSVNLDEEPDRLVMMCQNPSTGKRSCYNVVTPESPENSVARNPIESWGYNSELVISSILFHDMMRDLAKSDTMSVRVCCDGKRLVLNANGRHIKASFEIRNGTELSHFVYNPKPSDRWPVCECFSMSFLQRVAKAKGVAQYISVHMQPNSPIAFAYKTAIGTLSFTIAPREDEEWIENPSTRMMPSPTDDIKGITPRARALIGSKKRGTEDDTEEKKKSKKQKRQMAEEEEEEEESSG